jgi:hypothetical protein
MGSGGRAPPFLISAAVGGEQSVARSYRLTPPRLGFLERGETIHLIWGVCILLRV